MVKDIVVNLTGGHPQDFAADYAISLAAAFGAHIAGVGFIYEPVIPGSVLGGVPKAVRRPCRDDERVAGADGLPRAVDVDDEAPRHPDEGLLLARMQVLPTAGPAVLADDSVGADDGPRAIRTSWRMMPAATSALPAGAPV